MLVLIRAKEAHLGEVVMVPLKHGGHPASSRDGMRCLVHHHRVAPSAIVFSELSASHDDGNLRSGVKLVAEVLIGDDELVIAHRDAPTQMLAAHLYGDDPRLRR